MGVFVSAGLISAPGTPCSIRKGEERRKKKEFYIYLDVTRTHTRQEWIIIWSGRNWILKHADSIRNNEINDASYE